MNSNARLIQMLAESPIIVRRRRAANCLKVRLKFVIDLKPMSRAIFTYALVAKPGSSNKGPCGYEAGSIKL